MPFCCIKNALFYQVPLNVLEIEKVSKLRDYQHFSSRDGSTGRGATPSPQCLEKGVGQKIIISWSKCGYDGLIFRKNYNFRMQI